MENYVDKFGSLIIPNCPRTASQDEKLQSCPFARQSKVFLSSDDIQVQSSSSSSSPEQPTGIEMVSLPDSFDEYQTPPEQPFSQNSSNDGHVVVTKTAPFDEQRVVDLANEEDNLDNEPINVDDETEAAKFVTEGFETEVISSPDESAHQVFDKMRQREQEISNTKKRKLPVLLKTRKENGNCLKHGGFKDLLNRVLKMVESRSGEDDGGDFMETAKMRGLTFPRPRWWPAEGFEE